MTEKYLEFLVGTKHFAYSIEKIREIIEYPLVEPISGAPEQVLGVMNLRGQLVAVFDVAIFVGEPSEPVNGRTCVIVTEIVQAGERVVVANKVDLVRQVIDIEQEQLEAVPAVHQQMDSPLIGGMAKLENRLLTILDIDKLLSENQWQWLMSQHQEAVNE